MISLYGIIWKFLNSLVEPFPTNDANSHGNGDSSKKRSYYGKDQH